LLNIIEFYSGGSAQL